MFGFLKSILGGVEHVAGKVVGFIGTSGEKALVTGLQLVGPLVSLINPGAGAIASKVLSSVLGVESMFTTAQQGIAKKQTAAQIIVSEVPQLEAVVSEFGPDVKIPEAELGALIDAAVAFWNAIARLIDAIRAANAPKS